MSSDSVRQEDEEVGQEDEEAGQEDEEAVDDVGVVVLRDVSQES